MNQQSKRALLVAILSLIGLGGWLLYERGAPGREAERLRAEAKTVGTDASIAAAYLGTAEAHCKAIGVPNIDQCKMHVGPLLEDQTAPVVAKGALTNRDAYFAKCIRHNTREYCEALLVRAIAVSKAAPRSERESD